MDTCLLNKGLIFLSVFFRYICCKSNSCEAPFLKNTSHAHPRKPFVFSGITGLSYKDSGVDIEAGDRLVDAIKPLAAMTSRLGCSAELGMFGGLFDMKASGYVDPLLVSGTDGVGTKLEVQLY